MYTSIIKTYSCVISFEYPNAYLDCVDDLAIRRSLFRSGGCSAHARPKRSALTAGWLCRFFIRRCCCYCRFRRHRSPHHAASCCPDTNLQELDLKFYTKKQRNYTGKVSSLEAPNTPKAIVSPAVNGLSLEVGVRFLWQFSWRWWAGSRCRVVFRTAGLTSAVPPAQPWVPRRGKSGVQWSFIVQMTNMTVSSTPGCLLTRTLTVRNVAI